MTGCLADAGVRRVAVAAVRGARLAKRRLLGRAPDLVVRHAVRVDHGMQTFGPFGLPEVSKAGEQGPWHPLPIGPFGAQRQCCPGMSPVDPTSKQAPIPFVRRVQHPMFAGQPKLSVHAFAQIFSTPSSTHTEVASQVDEQFAAASSGVYPD
jgi:hypothetical protein